MQLNKLPLEMRVAALFGLACIALAGLGWGYGRFVSAHGICVGTLGKELVAHEFSLVPERADLAADRFCERANDVPNVARLLSARAAR